jgi:hypothetical protein
MRSPEIESARLERLLAGVAPETAQEAILQGLVRELRGGTAEAPLVLRERVRMICEPVPRSRVLVTRRRLAVVLVAALLALAGGVVASTRDSVSQPAATPAAADEHSGVTQLDGAEELVGGVRGHSATAESGVTDDGAAFRLQAAGATPLSPQFQGLKTAASGRAQDIDLSMAIRLADADALSQATNDALALTKDLGGFVRSSNVNTQGEEGAAVLQLRIPVAKLEDVVVGLSALGTITKPIRKRSSIAPRKSRCRRC